MNFIELSLPRETVLKLARLGKFLLDGYKTPFTVTDMPGQRHPDKTTLAIYIPRTLMQRVRRLAAERGETVTAVVEAAVTAQTRKVSLTPEDYDQIARETREATARSRRKRVE